MLKEKQEKENNHYYSISNLWQVINTPIKLEYSNTINSVISAITLWNNVVKIYIFLKAPVLRHHWCIISYKLQK